MTSEIKLRMTAFKDSEIKNYDQNISKYSHKAIDVRPIILSEPTQKLKAA